MSLCAACEKPIRRNVYRWVIGWDRGDVRGRKAFEVDFHRDPDCLGIILDRLSTYSWEQRMAKVIEGMGWEGESEFVEVTEQ